MAYYSDNSFSTFQGRAETKSQEKTPARRLRLPIATLALGAIAAFAIAGGALNQLPMPQLAHSLTDELSEIQFLTGTIE